MTVLILILIQILNIYLILLLASVIASWLVVFDVLNGRNAGVRKVLSWLSLLTEPPLTALRKIVPPLGGMDFTPMILWFGIILLERALTGLL